jgi:hypothetical protein
MHEEPILKQYTILTIIFIALLDIRGKYNEVITCIGFSISRFCQLQPKTCRIIWCIIILIVERIGCERRSD